LDATIQAIHTIHIDKAARSPFKEENPSFEDWAYIQQEQAVKSAARLAPLELAGSGCHTKRSKNQVGWLVGYLAM
jgi:hypothetical protein